MKIKDKEYKKIVVIIIDKGHGTGFKMKEIHFLKEYEIGHAGIVEKVLASQELVEKISKNIIWNIKDIENIKILLVKILYE
jgi:hypothetical protein